MWANGTYAPPVMVSTTDVIARMNADFASSLKEVKQNQLLLMKIQRRLSLKTRTRVILRK